jgi:hypothetical protein
MNKENILINLYKQIKNLNGKELYDYILKDKILFNNNTEFKKLNLIGKQITNIILEGTLAKKEQQIYDEFEELNDEIYPYSYMGTIEESSEFEEKDIQLYEQLQKRSNILYDEAYSKFMGFYKEPSMNLTYFTNRVIDNINYFNTLVMLKTPEELMYQESEKLKNKLKSYTEDKFEDIEDDIYINACLGYIRKHLSWNISQERKKIVTNLYLYNKKQYSDKNLL